VRCGLLSFKVARKPVDEPARRHWIQRCFGVVHGLGPSLVHVTLLDADGMDACSTSTIFADERQK
jgi:hypothetical protein